ncbi:hypothetical protein BKA70DRAFT_1097544 [Coprinopsis sp. MPI-PUGE-AT-0042]|nr:hypothetical protein BKA70DRAFT_1097544 [Coprinopsis sp. MPI-PUGE-AT-0042]
MSLPLLLSTLCNVASPAMAHVAAFGPGMYCGKGNEGFDDNNTNAAVQPMRNMTRSDWWLHHFNRCDEFPPPDGEFLVLPSGGEVTLELAVNRAFTTRAIRPNLSDWPHGKSMDPALGQSSDGCWFEPNLHTRSEVEAAGTALAISYATGLSNVKPENLVIFSVAAHTPWRRLTTYQIPRLPRCPPSGCTCAWGWVPEGCGAPDIYMQIFKCTVTNYPGSAKVMVPKGVPPVWCEDDPRSCVQGPKQMVYWGQREGNNVFTASNNKDGSQRRPAYNYRMGFMAGEYFLGWVGMGCANEL